MGKIKQFVSLSTSYVNLAALIRQLREEHFDGSIQVALEGYEAIVFLNGDSSAIVSEIDIETHAASETEGAMERLLVHAREPGGTITVYENEPESAADSGAVSGSQQTLAAFRPETPPNQLPPEVEVEWDELLRASAELVKAIERAMEGAEPDFVSHLRSVRVELGDDYGFIDPSTQSFEYNKGKVILNKRPSANAFITRLTECLRRMVNKSATGKEGKRFRERVAAELAVALRQTGLAAFEPLLDRIAGTRVL